MSIDVLAVQEHKRTSLDVHKSLLLPGWQFLLNETPSPALVALDTFCHLVVVVVELPQAPEDDPQKR